MTTPKQSASASLTPKQRRFVDEYLVDLNGTQAAIRAGYSRKTARSIAEENLTKPDIARAVTLAQTARAERTELAADRVLRELARIAFSDIRRLFDERGVLRNIAELSDDETAALAAVEVTELYEGRGEERRLIGYTRKLRFWDKRAALELAMRHLGLLKERVEHAGEMKITRTIVHVTRHDAPREAAGLTDVELCTH
jgi:phage terminase small subunit